MYWHLCQLDYRTCTYRKYIYRALACCTLLDCIPSACCLSVTSQVPIKRLLCLGTAKAVLFLSVVRVQFFLATQNLWNALGSLCYNSMLQSNNTSDNQTYITLVAAKRGKWLSCLYSWQIACTHFYIWTIIFVCFMPFSTLWHFL